MIHRAVAAVLPSPAPSDEPSPILSSSPVNVNHTRNDARRDIQNDENRRLSSMMGANPTQNQQMQSQAGFPSRTTDTLPRSPPSRPAPSNQPYNQPQRQSPSAAPTPNSQPPSTTTEMPPLPDSVLLPPEQQYRRSAQEIRTTTFQAQPLDQNHFQTSPQQPSFGPGSTPSTSEINHASTTEAQAQPQVARSTQGFQQWQSSHGQPPGQLPSPIQTNTSSPRTASAVPPRSTLPQNEARSYPSPGTFPSNPHKRQRIQGNSMVSLKSRIPQINAYIDSVGGSMNLNKGLEQPRFQLLRDACEHEDSFYVALHQLFCVWDFNRNDVAGIQGFPEMTVLEVAFKILSHLIRENDQLAQNHKIWFATFPGPLQDLLSRFDFYRKTVAEVGIFLGRLASDWGPLSQEVINRHYPPLVDELVNRLGLLSSGLQGVVFTAARRNLGFYERTQQEVAAAARMENLFKKDQNDYHALAARYHTGRPPSGREVQERNNALIVEYLSLFNELLQRRSSESALSSPATQLPTPVVPNNAHVQAGPPNPAVMPRPQPSNHQGSWQQSAPGPDPNGNWQFTNQHNPSISRTMSGSPNPLMAGRPPSVGAQRVYQNTPSPTLLQTLTMQSPVQQGFQFTPVLRNNSGQMHVSQNAPSFAPIGSFYQHQNGHTDPSLQRAQIPLQQPHQVAAQVQQQQQQQIAAQQSQQVVAQMHQQQMAQQQGQWQHQHQIQQQTQQQQNVLAQQVLNMNRAHQLRRDSNAVNGPQQQVHSRNNSISSNGIGTPVINHAAMPSPRVVAPPLPGPGRPTVGDARQAQIVQNYMRTPPLQRPLVPPLGFEHPQQQPQPAATALHQAQVRSPRLVSIEVFPSNISQDAPARRYYQAVKGFVMDPTRIPANSPLTRWDFKLSEQDFAMVSRDFLPGNGQVATREFTRGTLQYRLRCIQTKKTVTKCLTPEWTVTDTLWPEGASLDINRFPLEIRRKTHHGKDLPIDITPYVTGPGSVNRISMSITRSRNKMKEYGWFLAVETIEILQHNQILEMCHQNRIPAGLTLDKIKKSLAGPSGDDDDDIAMVLSDLSIDLADPFMSRIFEVPVRGSSCLHRECFDLETFLLTRNSKPKRPDQPSMIDVWKCPLCGNDCRPYSLQIDDFLVSVRATLAEQGNLDAKVILIGADGQWRPKEDLKRSHPDDDDDDSTDDDLGIMAANRAGSKRPVEVISLDDD
jgi:hypothetical protein